MNNKLNYSFTAIPTHLRSYCDMYCSFVLTVLIEQMNANMSKTFKTNNVYLQQLTGLSKRVINATLSSLHRNGIISVACVGQSRSKKCNLITINTSKFEEYDNKPFCNAMTDIDKRIVIDNYAEKGYKVSYLQNNEVSLTHEELEETNKIEVTPTVSTTLEYVETSTHEEMEESKEVEEPVVEVTPTVKVTPVETPLNKEDKIVLTTADFENEMEFFDSAAYQRKVNEKKDEITASNTADIVETKKELSFEESISDCYEDTYVTSTPTKTVEPEPVKETKNEKTKCSDTGDTIVMLYNSALEDGYEFNTDCDYSSFTINNIKCLSHLEEKHQVKFYRKPLEQLFNYALNKNN